MRLAFVVAFASLALLTTSCIDTAQTACPSTHAVCDGRCIDVTTDALNCGTCGNACTPGLVCYASACVSGTRTVTSRFWTDHWLDDGSLATAFGTMVPGTTVSALVPDGSGNGYAVYLGSVTPDGVVSIPHVPRGDYLLRIEQPYTAYIPEAICNPNCYSAVTLTDTQVIQFATSEPPLRHLVAHRPDLARVTQPTPVHLNVTNLDPASIGYSQLWAESGQADLDLYLARPPAGATTYTADVDWTGPFVVSTPPTGLPSPGDAVYVLQRTTLPLPGWSGTSVFRVTTRAAALTDLALADAVGGTLDVALSPVPLSESISLQLAAKAFQSAGAGMRPPGSTVAYPMLTAGVYGVPHTASYPAPTPVTLGWLPATPAPFMRMFYLTLDGPFSADANLGNIAYGGFVDDLWARILRVYYSEEIDYVVPGTGQTYPASPTLSVSFARSDVPAGPIAPALGPPTAPRVASRDARSIQQGVGTAPLLSWGAPTLGVPSAYEVAVAPVDPHDPGVTARLYGVTSFRVPPGILVPGHWYVAYITAISGPGYLPEVDPFIASLPRYQADCVTALFSP